jgi:hypothetical protein
MTQSADTGRDFSLIVISLLKGVLCSDNDPALWQKFLDRQAGVRDYVRVLGLELIIHEDEGFAWLKRAEVEDDSGGLPSLTFRRQLSYPVSLLLVMLRRRLAEHDASSGESRLILDRTEIVDMMKTFLPAGTNEARIVDQIDAHLNKAADLGFVRRLKMESGKIEVRRILKAFVDAQWLNEFDVKLKSYVEGGARADEDGEDRE